MPKISRCQLSNGAPLVYSVVDFCSVRRECCNICCHWQARRWWLRRRFLIYRLVSCLSTWTPLTHEHPVGSIARCCSLTVQTEYSVACLCGSLAQCALSLKRLSARPGFNPQTRQNKLFQDYWRACFEISFSNRQEGLTVSSIIRDR